MDCQREHDSQLIKCEHRARHDKKPPKLVQSNVNREPPAFNGITLYTWKTKSCFEWSFVIAAGFQLEAAFACIRPKWRCARRCFLAPERGGRNCQRRRVRYLSRRKPSCLNGRVLSRFHRGCSLPNFKTCAFHVYCVSIHNRRKRAF